METTRLTYDQQHYVIARSPSTGETLLGGLGCLGIGQMWFAHEESHIALAGYDTAAVVNRDATEA